MIVGREWFARFPGILFDAPAPPARLLTLIFALTLLLNLGSAAVAMRQPRLGIDLVQNAQPESFPRVQRSPELSDVIEISDRAGNSMRLRSDDLEREPDVPFDDYPSFNRFLDRQDRLSGILHSGEVRLLDSDGRGHVLHPAPHRSLFELPWLFWYQLLVGVGCWLCGACILAFRRDDRAARYSALAGFGLMLCTASSAIYSTRELALAGSVFRALLTVNHLGSMLACGAFIAVFWHYPKRMAQFDIGPLLLAAYLSIGLCDYLQVLPLGNYGMQLAIMSGGMGGGLLATLQWRRTRGDALQRASLQWFLLSWCLGFGVYLVLVTIPALAGFDSGDLEGYAYGGCLLIAFGLSLGIARYKLYELENWWIRTIGFLIGGAMVVLMDVLLSSVLAFGSPTALAVSLGFSGWLYFPLRQWLIGRVYTSARRLPTRDLPTLLHDVISRDLGTTDKLLPEALRRLYSPLSLKPLPVSPPAVRIADNGLALEVPGFDRLPGWEARWPDGGNRLFSSYDIETMTAVRAVLERIAAYQHAVQHGIDQERMRLTQDLHDDIGARLLTLLHRHPGAISRDIRDVLERLRATVHGLGAAALPLTQCVDAWRSEAAERCNAVDVDLEWHQPQALPPHVFNAVEQVDLTRILREAISNALKHARLRRLRVGIATEAGRVRIEVVNDGVKENARIHPGLGLRNMRTRIVRLGGELEIDLRPPQARVAWTLPLVAPQARPTPLNRGYANR